MKINEAIKNLGIIKAAHGNIELHLEVGEDRDCEKCGQSKYVNFCGTCTRIGTINIAGVGVSAWLVANNGE